MKKGRIIELIKCNASCVIKRKVNLREMITFCFEENLQGFSYLKKLRPVNQGMK